MVRLFVTPSLNRKTTDNNDNVMIIDGFSKRGRHNPNDTRFKSLLKTISSWILVSTDTLMIAWLLTGNLKTAGSIMSLEIFTKMSLYSLHERFWTRFS